MRVLLVKTDVSEALGLISTLKAGGLSIAMTRSGEELREMLDQHIYDIVVLDLTSTNMNRRELIHHIRKVRPKTLVLALFDFSYLDVKVRDSGLGADDLICRPYNKANSIDLIQAVAWRNKSNSHPPLRVANLLLYLDCQEVTVNGKTLHLTGAEYSILELLVLNKGVVLPKQYLIGHLYGGMNEPELRIVDVFIYMLRKKLTQAGADNLIEMVWDHGYTLRNLSTELSSAPQEEIAQGINHPKLTDRRRSGRLLNVNSNLIPLLRNPLEINAEVSDLQAASDPKQDDDFLAELNRSH